jgi:hypothetical protein
MKKPQLLQAGLGLALLIAVAGVLMLSQWAAQGYAAVPTGAVGARFSSGAPLVRQTDRSDVSPPLRSIKPIGPSASSQPKEAPENPRLPTISGNPFGPDPVLQHGFGALAMPTPILNFEGQPNLWAVFPPDPNGDVGRNNYIQIVNSGFDIYTKSGTSLYGPANTNTLFTGFGGLCESTNNGDPIAHYDAMADRWLLSQFAIDTNGSDTHQCFAISTGPDPLGSWYRYDFHVSPISTAFQDYPHIGVWPDAYYMTTNQFGGTSPGGAFAFNRVKMLQGDHTAEMVYFGTPTAGMQPSDMGGSPPPAGRPNYFLALGPASTQLQEYQFHVDWTNPNLSTFTGPTLITVPAYNQTLCNGVRGSCIDQPGTVVRLEAITDRLMYRLQYRNFPGDHETLVVNHTVNANGQNPGLAGIRWYEIRNPFTTTVAYQASTYSPDTDHRWMGSAAMDRFGDIAIGYSVSSSVVSPSIRYAGRLVTDPLNTLAQGEASLIAGGGSQLRTQGTNDGRWGDYTALQIDPVDDCTYWYTNEYIRRTTDIGWTTRIGSFKFPGCTGQATPTPVPSATGVPPSASPTPQATPTFCPGGVSVTGSITNTDPTMNGRLSRGNPPSTCANPRPAPATVNGPLPHYRVYTYTNTLASPQCVTVSLNSRSCGGPGVFGSAYLNSFDPNNLQLNYLADLGVSGPVGTFSFDVPANATYVVVVQEIGTDLGCSSFTLTINPCLAPPVTPSPTPNVTATPTPSSCVGTTYQVFPSTGATLIPATNDIGNHCDDCVTNVNLPFPVTVYGTPYTSANVGSNGLLNFNSTQQNIYTNNCLPVHSNPPPFASTLFPYYDDLRTDVMTSTHGIYSATIGSAPNREFVLEWHATYYFSDTAETNFEVILNENSPVMSVIYGQNATVAQGANPASGIQLNLNQYTAYSCDTDLPAGTRVDYVPITCGITPTVTPGPATSTATNTPIRPTPTACTLQFRDVPPGSTFYPYVHCLACLGIVNGYPDGTFRPNANVTRGQLSKIVSNSAGFNDTPTGQQFQDVPAGSTFYVYIYRLSHRGFISGYACGAPPAGACVPPDNLPYFLPNANATRGQISKIVSNAAGFSDTPTGQQFQDVPVGSTFYVYIYRLSHRGIISGYPCGSVASEPCVPPGNLPYFRPNNNATRGQMSKIDGLAFFPNCNIPAQSNR